MLKTLLSDLCTITNQFCDLVLGLSPQEARQFCGEMIEVYADDPCLLDEYVEKSVLLDQNKSVALLGFEPGRFQCGQKKTGTTRIVMPAENALQLLFAAQELLLSKAIDVIVICEIMLKSDEQNIVLSEIRNLHRLVYNTDTQLVLLNPNTSERMRLAAELKILCSRQISL